MCLWNTMPLEATKSKKTIFSTMVKVKVIDLGIIRKGNISRVFMQNMKSLSLTVKKV